LIGIATVAMGTGVTTTSEVKQTVVVEKTIKLDEIKITRISYDLGTKRITASILYTAKGKVIARGRITISRTTPAEDGTKMLRVQIYNGKTQTQKIIPKATLDKLGLGQAEGAIESVSEAIGQLLAK
jgi:hypothetical protein